MTTVSAVFTGYPRPAGDTAWARLLPKLEEAVTLIAKECGRPKKAYRPGGPLRGLSGWRVSGVTPVNPVKWRMQALDRVPIEFE